MATKKTGHSITVIPANKATWQDLQAVFGERGYAAQCQCQFFKIRGREWDGKDAFPVSRRAKLLRQQTQCNHPAARNTSGLVAYLNGEPAGWCAVEPRIAYIRLQKKPLVWAGRPKENKADASVWAITCMITRAGFRKRGVTYALARAAVDFARKRGARALEGYPLIVKPGEEITWGEMYVGNHKVFAAAGFKEVSHPTPRRVVMRIDF